MEDKELRGLLTEILDVIGDLATTVQSITPTADYRIADDMERTAREERARTGAVRPRKALSLAEKVASLRERGQSLQPSDDSDA